MVSTVPFEILLTTSCSLPLFLSPQERYLNFRQILILTQLFMPQLFLLEQKVELEKLLKLVLLPEAY